MSRLLSSKSFTSKTFSSTSALATRSFEGNRSYVGPNYDVDAIKYFTRLSQISNSPSTFYEQTINQLVLDLKGLGNVGVINNWQYLTYMGIFATEIQDHAQVDLILPTRSLLIENLNPMWTQWMGYTGDNSAYLDTGFNPDLELTATDFCHLVYNRTNVSNANALAGLFSSVPNTRDLTIFPHYIDNLMYVGLGGSNEVAVYSNLDSRGLIGGFRNNNSQGNLVKNGSVVATGVSTLNGLVNMNDYVLAINSSGSPAARDNRQASMRIWGTASLDQPSLYAAIQAFATTIGFNV